MAKCDARTLVGGACCEKWPRAWKRHAKGRDCKSLLVVSVRGAWVVARGTTVKGSLNANRASETGTLTYSKTSLFLTVLYDM